MVVLFIFTLIFILYAFPTLIFYWYLHENSLNIDIECSDDKQGKEQNYFYGLFYMRNSVKYI